MSQRRAWTTFVEGNGRHKYSAKKTTASDGTVFPSKREAARYEELLLLKRLGKIIDLQCQVKYELIPKQDGERAANYIADFVYVDDQSVKHVEDTKGFKTPEYILKRKLMRWVYGIKIEEV